MHFKQMKDRKRYYSMKITLWTWKFVNLHSSKIELTNNIYIYACLSGCRNGGCYQLSPNALVWHCPGDGAWLHAWLFVGHNKDPTVQMVFFNQLQERFLYWWPGMIWLPKQSFSQAWKLQRASGLFIYVLWICPLS